MKYLFIHYESNDAYHENINDIIIPKIPLKLNYPVNIPNAVKELDMDCLHVPAHWYSPDSLFFLG